MHYAEVLVGDATFHGNDALTYSALEPLEPGQIVQVPLRAKKVLGIVVAAVDKPSFPAKSVLQILDLPLLPAATFKTIRWMQQYYPSPFGVIVSQFLPKNLPKSALQATPLPPPAVKGSLPPLTSGQEYALRTISGSGTSLLHGETGTGKTRIYIELARRSIAQGKSAVILTPEIGLTSQLQQDFQNAFGKNIMVIHSRLTDATRQKLWVRCLRQAEPVIVIGPRSALFMPLRDIGLIAIDEAHETSYKQDQAPYYQTARVASVLAGLHNAPIVLGSATPLVTDYFMAEAKKRPIIRLTGTARQPPGNEDRSISIVDLKDHSKFTRKPYLSDELIADIQVTLAKHEQTLLFLNRRGTARVVFCEKCGWQATCPHCDLPLVYHGDRHIMRCHSCEYKAAPPTSCPECRSPSIIFKSIGTKAVEEEITALFPEARVRRFDTDNRATERIEDHYDAIKRGDIDIIIGTQTLVKGLDLPYLSLVGVVIADTSLYFPDFSATERTYQLLSQVVGRVGRGHRAGKVVLQTYAPDSPLLKAIVGRDWETFYASELRERQLFLFPPFCYLLKLHCRRASSRSAEMAATAFAADLRRTTRKIIVEGPVPAFHEKVQNKYQWQIIVKTKDRAQLTGIISQLPSGWAYDIDPMNLL